MVGKKVYVILGLLLATALAEKKINLDDIERDNLRAESKSSNDNEGADDSQYNVSDKPETSQQEYQQGPQQYEAEDVSARYQPQQYEHNDVTARYQPQQYEQNDVTARYQPQQLQEKYAIQSEDYPQDPKYVETDGGYQQTSQPAQQYVEYQQQQQQHVEIAPPKGLSHASTYEAPQQQLVYQQEIAVGNQYQSIQQKAANEKYLKNSNKEPLYVNIPMEQLLAYYPNLLNQSPVSKGSIQPLLHLATQAAQQISIPVYEPNLRRDPIYEPSKVQYQYQPQYLAYPTKYPQHTEAILPTKQPKKLIYTQQSLLSHQLQPQAQPQQYLQEIVYAQPGAVYAPTVPSSHADVYERPSVNLQGHSLGQTYASQTRHQQQYSPAYSLPGRYYTVQPGATHSPQPNHQIYQQQSPDTRENYEAVPESPGNGFDLPRRPAQQFKSNSGFRLVQVPGRNYDLTITQNHYEQSPGPKSLLDSYVPSRIIAAQDTERYRERPIKLESGFLPSQINFAQTYKKRKAE